MELQVLLKPTWDGLKTYRYEGKTYYLGCEVVEMLRLSNITQAMGRSKKTPKISRTNWSIKMIPEVNAKRGVYLFTYEGIEEIVLNNKNQTCKDLQSQLKVT